MPEGVPSNPYAGAAAVPVVLAQKSFVYANVANGGLGYAKYDVLSSQIRRNGNTGAVIGTDWFNETQKVALGAAPVNSEITAPPSDGLVDAGNPVVTNIPDTVGGTALGANPAGTNYVSLFIDGSQANGVNYTVDGVAPVTGQASAGQLELQPGGVSSVVSGADLANLKLISKVAAQIIKVTAIPFVKLTNLR